MRLLKSAPFPNTNVSKKKPLEILKMKLSLCIFLCLLEIPFIHCKLLEFDKKYFGVTFSPYVKHKKPNGNFTFKGYSKRNLETMLTLVSTRFSNVFVEDNYSFQGQYIRNKTYNHGTYASIYSGEIAAKLNKKNGKKMLTLWYEISILEDDLDAEIQVVFEAAERANHIFPGTVEAIIFGRTRTLAQLDNILQYYQTYKNKSIELNVKLGAELISCFYHLNRKNATIEKTQTDLIVKSQVVTCSEIVPGNPAAGAKDSFQSVFKDILNLKGKFEKINPIVIFVGNMQWSSYGEEKWQTVENLKDYWEWANTFASTVKFPVFLKEAFDNPFRKPPILAHLGWWNLIDNSKIDSIDGYVEKVAEMSDLKKTDTTVTWSETTIVLCVLGGMFLTMLFLLGFAFLRSKTQPNVLTSNEIKLFISGSRKIRSASKATELEDALNGPYDKSLEIPKSKLKIDDDTVLGTGTFGCVYKATIEMDGNIQNDVALKVANEISSITLKGLLSEIKIMSYLGKHANIVALEGAYTAELAHGVVYVATELCTLGSLESFLRKYPLIRNDVDSQKKKRANPTENDMAINTDLSISIVDMIGWSHQIARGMEYLESKHVVHADLATRNVLLNSEKVAKVSDFGLSRKMYNYMNYVKTHQEPLPWRWMAIESLKRMEFSSQSDVWSFGVTLWEIFTKGDIPYQGLSWTQGFSNDLTDGLRPECPLLASPEVYKVMQDCWICEPSNRPSFNELVSRTDELLQNYNRTQKESVVHIYLDVKDIKRGNRCVNSALS